MSTRRDAYTVFAQQTGARLDVAAWHRHAQSFFDASVALGLAGEPRVAFWRQGEQKVERSVIVRARTAGDLEAAVAAERTSGGAGLSLLAKRCPMVVVIETETHPDSAALLLAAIIAGAALGPILTPSLSHIWGAMTARQRWEVDRGER